MNLETFASRGIKAQAAVNETKTDKTAYPLYWPDGRPITPGHQRKTQTRFQTTFAAARDACRREIKLLGGSDVLISTNIPLKRDGVPYSVDWGKQMQDGRSPGVAVFFKRNGKELVFACDSWNHVQDNMHAISLTIEALRGIARWGTGDMMEAAFRGFRALPAPGESSGICWWKVLGVPVNSTRKQVADAFKILAHKNHPDHGGDSEMFQRVTEAWDQFNATHEA